MQYAPLQPGWTISTLFFFKRISSFTAIVCLSAFHCVSKNWCVWNVDCFINSSRRHATRSHALMRMWLDKFYSLLPSFFFHFFLSFFSSFSVFTQVLLAQSTRPHCRNIHNTRDNKHSIVLAWCSNLTPQQYSHTKYTFAKEWDRANVVYLFLGRELQIAFSIMQQQQSEIMTPTHIRTQTRRTRTHTRTNCICISNGIARVLRYLNDLFSSAALWAHTLYGEWL